MQKASKSRTKKRAGCPEPGLALFQKRLDATQKHMKAKLLPPRIYTQLNKIHTAVGELHALVGDVSDEPKAHLAIRKGKPTLQIETASGAWRAESFHDLVAACADISGSGFTAEEIHDLEIWQATFERATKLLQSRVIETRKEASRRQRRKKP